MGQKTSVTLDKAGKACQWQTLKPIGLNLKIWTKWEQPWSIIKIWYIKGSFYLLVHASAAVACTERNSPNYISSHFFAKCRPVENRNYGLAKIELAISARNGKLTQRHYHQLNSAALTYCFIKSKSNQGQTKARSQEMFDTKSLHVSWHIIILSTVQANTDAFRKCLQCFSMLRLVQRFRPWLKLNLTISSCLSGIYWFSALLLMLMQI